MGKKIRDGVFNVFLYKGFNTINEMQIDARMCVK